MGRCNTFLLLIAITIISSVFVGVYMTKRVNIPKHLLHNPSVFMEDLLTPEQGDTLMSLAKEMKEFPVNVADLKVIYLLIYAIIYIHRKNY